MHAATTPSLSHLCGAAIPAQLGKNSAVADSPLEGRTVRISALVSAVSGSGFYVQDDSGYGLYVYESTFRPAVGDTVVLVGSISEFHGLTELSHLDSAQSRVVTSGGAAPSPLAA